MTWEEYEKKLKGLGYKEEVVAKIKPAFLFAEEAHKEEKRASGEPYITHPIAVSLRVAELHLDPDTISASLLHDVVENQGVKIEKIEKQFGGEIAFLVGAVTKVDKVQYSGAERAVESLRKMFLATAKDIRVVIIKLMDRLHNMETISSLPEEKKKRIALETLELYAPLADRLGMWSVKAELEDLAFPITHPEEYKLTVDQVGEKKGEREKYLEKFKTLIEEELKKENIIPASIVYRAKHLYSIWKKLVRNEMNVERIMDLVAMRVVLRTIEDCYKTLGVIHKVWKPMPGHIKDFIALPKPNGYQSLHTYVFGPDKKVVSLHIRTEEMDQEAEYGIAAHWFYEAGGKKKITEKLDEKRFSWVRQLQEWQKEHQGKAHDEALSALKIDFFKNRIFTLTPRGDVIDLPEGASPIDFAYHVHSGIGDHMSGAKVDRKMVPFSYQLKSGETVEILTQKNKKPTKDWLEFAKTSLAKGHIRSFLRKEGILETPVKKKEKFEAVITVKDRVGLLRDISSVFSGLKINITETKSGALSREHHRITIGFLPSKNIPHSKILTSLKQIKNVESIVIKEVK